MSAQFNWNHLEKLDAALAWRHEAENAALANVWHFETVADLARELRRLLAIEEADERLIGLLWSHLSVEGQALVRDELSRPGGRYSADQDRIDTIVANAT